MHVSKETISSEFSTDMARYIDKIADKMYNLNALYVIMVEKGIHIV